MDQRLFIYTRLFRLDYHLIYCPNNSFMPNDIKTGFKDFAREVINEDRITNGKIEDARWSFCKKGEYLLYGIGCRNVLLSEESNDYVGTPIRGFFGLVIKLDGSFPIDLYLNIDSYKRIYKEKIVPIFHSKTSVDSSDIDSPFELLSDAMRIFPHDNKQVVNFEKTKTFVFPDTFDVKEIAASLVFGDGDTNFVFHLNNEGHIRHTKLCSFYNASIIGNDKQYVVERGAEKTKNGDDEGGEEILVGDDEKNGFVYYVGSFVEIIGEGTAWVGKGVAKVGRRIVKYSKKNTHKQYCKHDKRDDLNKSDQFDEKAYPSESESNESDWLIKMQSKYE